MNKPLVSVIIPVWNAGASICNMTDAILGQSFRDFELILVDDGSTDNTLSVLRKIEKVDSRVRVFTKPNGGPSSARNLGLEKAVGEYIQFYDADDKVAQDALQIVITAIKKSKSDLTVSGWSIDLRGKRKRIDNYKHISPKRELVSNNLEAYVLRSLGTNGMLYNLWNKLFRADIIREHHLRFREDLSFGEDLIFALHYFSHISHLQVISDITYHYQESSAGTFGKSALNTTFRRINSEELAIFASNNQTPEISDLFHWIEWRWLLSYWLLVARSHRSYRQKIVSLKKNLGGEYIVAKTTRFIGFKKALMERSAAMLRRLPHLTLWVMSLAVALKHFRTWAKSL